MLPALQGIQYTLHILGLDIVRFEWKVNGDIIDLDCGRVRSNLDGSSATVAIGRSSSGSGYFGSIVPGVGGGWGLAFVVGGQHGALQKVREGWRVLENANLEF